MAYRAYRSRGEMLAAGWQFPSPEELSECNRCGARISWAKSPKGASVPMQPGGSSVVHFDVCDRASAAPAPAANRTPTSPAPQASPAGATQPPPSPAALVQALQEHTSAIRELTMAIRERAAVAG